MAKYPFSSKKYANYQIPLKSSFDAPFDESSVRSSALRVNFTSARRPLGSSSSVLKGPLKYLLMPLLGTNQLAITLHIYASIGPNLDNTHRGQIYSPVYDVIVPRPMSRDQ